MSFVTDTFNSVGGTLLGINWEALLQVTLVGLIMISGPVVIFLLAARGGDL